jgi:hypothetical protein
VADIAGADIAGGIGGVAGEGEFSCSGSDKLSRDAEERSLAGAVAAGEDRAFTGGNFERDAAKREESAVSFIDALEAETSWR